MTARREAPTDVDSLHGVVVCELGLLLHGDPAKVDRSASEARLYEALDKLATLAALAEDGRPWGAASMKADVAPLPPPADPKAWAAGAKEILSALEGRAGGLPEPIPEAAGRAGAAWWAARLQLDEKREAFRVALEPLLAKLFAEEFIPRDAPKRSVGVDYDPCELLVQALKEAGVECRGTMFSADGILPRKTRMHLRQEALEVSEGRGAPWLPIWFPPGKDLAAWLNKQSAVALEKAEEARAGRHADPEEVSVRLAENRAFYTAAEAVRSARGS